MVFSRHPRRILNISEFPINFFYVNLFYYEMIVILLVFHNFLSEYINLSLSIMVNMSYT